MIPCAAQAGAVEDVERPSLRAEPITVAVHIVIHLSTYSAAASYNSMQHGLGCSLPPALVAILSLQDAQGATDTLASGSQCSNRRICHVVQGGIPPEMLKVLRQDCPLSARRAALPVTGKPGEAHLQTGLSKSLEPRALHGWQPAEY